MNRLAAVGGASVTDLRFVVLEMLPEGIDAIIGLNVLIQFSMQRDAKKNLSRPAGKMSRRVPRRRLFIWGAERSARPPTLSWLRSTLPDGPADRPRTRPQSERSARSVRSGLLPPAAALRAGPAECVGSDLRDSPVGDRHCLREVNALPIEESDVPNGDGPRIDRLSDDRGELGVSFDGPVRVTESTRAADREHGNDGRALHDVSLWD